MIDREFARELHHRMSELGEPLFSHDQWASRILAFAAGQRDFMNALLQFVDVFPVLHSDDSLRDHIESYFAAVTCPDGFFTGDEKAFRNNIQSLFLLFVVGRDLDELIRGIRALASDGFAYTLDMLGEACLSEAEAQDYVSGQKQAITRIHNAGLPVHITLKPTSLYSQTGPLNFSRSVLMLADRMSEIVEQALKVDGFVHIDMEQRQFKNVTIEAFKELIRRYPQNANLGIAVQSYLKESESDILSLIDFARRRDYRFTVRLVKGAYYDWETLFAEQNNWPNPLWEEKWQTDIAYETNLAHLLSNSDRIFTAAATHNLRSTAVVKKLADEHGVDQSGYEYQMLYGMGSSMAAALRDMGQTVRLYAPFGPPVPGMAYLVRRLVENTALNGAVRTQFLQRRHLAELLADPRSNAAGPNPATRAFAGSGNPSLTEPSDRRHAFANHPPADFSSAEVRAHFADALENCESMLVAAAGIPDVRASDVDPAVQRAASAQKAWGDKTAVERGNILRRAAEIMSARIYQLAAVQVREVGKQWDQAYNDVCEAIDFLKFYAGEAEVLFDRRRLSPIPAERNVQTWRPRGVYGVIAPWNFPLAISCGMVSAALACGNSVLYKPAEESRITGALLHEILTEAGLPDGVLHFLPGPGESVGAALASHPGIRGIAFTGSREVGVKILEARSKPSAGSRHIAAVIAEMGGKNAIIVDADADIDTAVQSAIDSAFGFQGQKCSAASRIIIHREVYAEFSRRVVEAAQSLIIGEALDSGSRVGPLVSSEADKKLRHYLEIARAEGRELLYRHPLAIFEVPDMDRRICREEVFGPLLVLIPAESLEQAISMANDVDYGLTAGIISRNPIHIDLACRRLEAGNIYVNRGITGALVGRQPFGGHKLSGVGAKAGGEDYLKQFVNPVTISENLVRRGFSPEL